MEHLLATSDSQVLQKIMAFFEHDELAYDLTEEQWSLVEERIAKYERGEGKTPLVGGCKAVRPAGHA
ncbi:MAG: hypothetical protein IPO56_06760 [Flavobacteriales bacterium]|nr:hypothetical protein [Flavobacteriales bacterium]